WATGSTPCRPRTTSSRSPAPSRASCGAPRPAPRRVHRRGARLRAAEREEPAVADDLTRPTVEGPALADVVHLLADPPPDVLDHPVVAAAALVGYTAALLAGFGAVVVLRGRQRAGVEALCTNARYAALAGTVCWLLRDEHLLAAPATRAAVTPGALVR